MTTPAINTHPRTAPGACQAPCDEGPLEPTSSAGNDDHLPISAVLDLLPSLPTWPGNPSGPKLRPGHKARLLRGARTVLDWLSNHAGDGWQEKWVLSGADHDARWIDRLVAVDDGRSPTTRREEVTGGLTCLLLCRIVRPSYDFLASYKPFNLYTYARTVLCPELFDRVERRGYELEQQRRRVHKALVVISKIVLHTGRELDQLTADDLFGYRAWLRSTHHNTAFDGLSLGWAMLHGIADLGDHATLKDAVKLGQRPTAELVDAYNLQNQRVRDVLVRYLNERRPSLDYSSFTERVRILVGTFWADVEHHHPGIDTLHLSDPVAEAWKQRLQVVRTNNGGVRPRKDVHGILTHVRAFYLDLQEWAYDDPSWTEWSVPSPVRKRDTAGYAKAKRATTAAMHQRTRDRLPHLPRLVETAEQHKAEMTVLLAKASETTDGQIIEHNGRRYRRTIPRSYRNTDYRNTVPPVQVNEVATGTTINLDKAEHEAFWAWAAIEVLRHTGVRIEELLEITHLALVSYQLPDTGEVVPMLQVVPSKSNEERLLLVSPELASVLATIINRLRRANGDVVPLSARYDEHERVTGPPLPHLFQHRPSWSWEVPNPGTVQKWLTKTLARADVIDAAGHPLRYTPHDFRRMFATEAVTGGLPVHIVARLLGHKNLNTTQAYMAVFDEELVRSYRVFLDNRRALRPEIEYREPTDQEWREFNQHFQLRKLELGECGRPYGTPCKHEFACIRCPSLRLDLKARPRLVEIIQNLRSRIDEARFNGWLGEVTGLKASLNEASRKLIALDRARDRNSAGLVHLGMPVITADAQSGGSATTSAQH